MKPRSLFVAALVLFLTRTSQAQTFQWTNAAGGSWNDASNWNTNPDLPVFGPDVVVDFSKLNLTGNRTLNLGSTGKVVGKIIFGDTTPSHQWDIVAQNGPLVMQTLSGVPEIQVLDWACVITVNLAGNQGFQKTGSNILRLNNNGNAITGEILVREGSLQVRDGTTNNPTVFASATMEQRSLRVTGSGILDLWRVNASGTQNVNWTLPTITLENAGTLRFRTNNAATYDHSLNANLVIGAGGGNIHNNGGTGIQNITLGGILSGSQPVTYRADATGTARQLTIASADNPYTGDWTVLHAGAGTATLQAAAARALGTGRVTVQSNGRLLAGADAALDSLAGVTLSHAGASLDLADRTWNNPAATLTVTDGRITLGSGRISVASLAMSGGEIRATGVAGAPAAITTAGDAAFGGRPMTLSLADSPVGNSFELVRYSGNLVSAPALVLGVDAGRLTAVVDNGDGSDDAITLSFTGNVADLVWTGSQSAVWDDNATLNFLNSGTADLFRAFDQVRFDDSSATASVSLSGTLQAGGVTFDHSNQAFTVEGTGSISGPASLLKTGTQPLLLNTANSFFGPVDIQAGGIVLGNPAALGAAGVKTVTVQSGAYLDFNGNAPGTARSYTYRIAGNGGGAGALRNSQTRGIDQDSGILSLELLGDSAVGGQGRFDIGRTGTPEGGVLGNGHTLTKTGPNTIHLRGPAANTRFLIAEGTLAAQDNDLAFGGSDSQVTVQNGASALVQGALQISAPLRLEAESNLISGGGNGNWTGPVTLAGSARIGLGSASLQISGPISEEGGPFVLRKDGGNLLTLAGDNTFQGGFSLLGGQVTAASDTAFGTGTVTVERDEPAALAIRINLASAVIENDIILNSNAGTVSRGLISTAPGNGVSAVKGDITLLRAPANGGTFSAFDGGTLQILGAIHGHNGLNPSARSGIIEIGGGLGSYESFGHGEGILRIVSDNGILPTARLEMAFNGSSTFDLNGYNQTLAGLSRQTSAPATITNTFFTPSSLTIHAADVPSTFSGRIEDGSGELSLVKTGPESLTLSGIGVYSGATTVQQGTLRIDADHTLATGPITVAGASSRLAGGGSLGGELTVRDGATLAPGGAGTGTLVAEAPVLMQSNTTYTATLHSGNASTGGILLNAPMTLQPGVAFVGVDAAPSPAGIAPGTVLTLIDYGPYAFQGTFSGLPEGAPVKIGVNGFVISYQNNGRVTLTATGVDDPYLAWAASPAFGLTPGVNDGFTFDADGDGIANGLEWILGGNPSVQDAASLLAQSRQSDGSFRITFRREPASASFVDLAVEMDTDLAAPWTIIPIGASSSGPDVNGVTVTVDAQASPHQITVTIPASNAPDGRLFTRLSATPQ